MFSLTKKRVLKQLTVFICIVFASVTVFASSQQVSSTKASTIVDRVEVRLNDSDNRLWSPAEILVWVNEAMLDIVSRTHCLEATESINLATDTLEYTITSDYITVKAVHYIDSDSAIWALRKGSPSSVGQNTAVTIPTYWYEWNGKVGVYPLFTRTTETITVYYIERPTSIAATANITTPAIYDTALIYFVVAQAYTKYGKSDEFLKTMALYEAEMKRIRADLTEQPVEIVE